jgi:hypothetical protein
VGIDFSAGTLTFTGNQVTLMCCFIFMHSRVHRHAVGFGPLVILAA